MWLGLLISGHCFCPRFRSRFLSRGLSLRGEAGGSGGARGAAPTPRRTLPFPPTHTRGGLPEGLHLRKGGQKPGPDANEDTAQAQARSSLGFCFLPTSPFRDRQRELCIVANGEEQGSHTA